MKRIGIFVGAACHRPHDEFTKSLSAFLVSCSLKYDIECLSVYGQQLVDAQNIIADRFLKTDKQYLLMVEDDNWGFLEVMLDEMIEADKPVIGMKYHSRHSPHVVLPMRPHPYLMDKGMMELIGPRGIQLAYLVPFGMTLIKRFIFDILEKPYFALNEKTHPDCPTQYATDHNFCHRLMGEGVTLWGHYDFCINHRGMHQWNVEETTEAMLANSFRHNLMVRRNIKRDKVNV